MTIWELQKMSGEQMKSAISKMSRDDISKVIASCGTAQGKASVKRIWETVTKQKY